MIDIQKLLREQGFEIDEEFRILLDVIDHQFSVNFIKEFRTYKSIVKEAESQNNPLPMSAVLLPISLAFKSVMDPMEKALFEISGAEKFLRDAGLN